MCGGYEAGGEQMVKRLARGLTKREERHYSMYVLEGTSLEWGGRCTNCYWRGRGVDGGVWAPLHLNKRADGHGRTAYRAGVRMAVYGSVGVTVRQDHGLHSSCLRSAGCKVVFVI